MQIAKGTLFQLVGTVDGRQRYYGFCRALTDIDPDEMRSAWIGMTWREGGEQNLSDDAFFAWLKEQGVFVHIGGLDWQPVEPD